MNFWLIFLHKVLDGWAAAVYAVGIKEQGRKPAEERHRAMVSIRSVVLLLLGLSCAMLWLVLLEVSAFNVVTVSLGLIVMLAINSQTTRAKRW